MSDIIKFPPQLVGLTQLVDEQYPDGGEAFDEAVNQIQSILAGKSAPFAMLVMLVYMDLIMEWLETEDSKNRAGFIAEIREFADRWSK